MPFREQELIRLCVRCKKEASKACLRCDQPLCKEHTPGRGQRCEECESHFEETKHLFKPVWRKHFSPLANFLGILIAGCLGATVVVAIQTIFGRDFGGYEFPLGLFVAAGGYLKVNNFFSDHQNKKRALRRGRRKFLRERKKPLARLES